MSKLSCLVLNITKLKKKNVFVASRNVYTRSTTFNLTMCFRNDLFSGWNQLELYSDWSLSPKSDQHEFSLNNIKTSSIEKVRRSNKLMNKGD